MKHIEYGNKPVAQFFQIRKFDLARIGQSTKIDLILPRNHVLACPSDPAGNKPVNVMAFLQNVHI